MLSPLPSTLYPKSSPTGFTLIEILITITIISVVTLTGVTFGLTAYEKQQVIAAADTITVYLENAKTLSISNTDDKLWAVSFQTTTPPTVTKYCFNCPVGQQQPQIYRFPRSVVYKSTLPPGNLLVFQKFSGRAAGPSNAELKTANSQITVGTSKWETDVVVPPHGSVYSTTIRKL